MNNSRGFEREESLEKSMYFSEGYFDKYQLFALSEQIHLLYTVSKHLHNPAILEVGKGNGFVSDFFKKAKYNFTTLDINPNLEPDIVGNILELSQTVTEKPDFILCSEVLEHMEFKTFEKSIYELSETTKEGLIITLPVYKKFFGINIQWRMPKLKPFSTPLFIKTSWTKILPQEHFWEIGYSKETSKKNIEKILLQYFVIQDKGCFHTNPYHYYYVLKKKSL